MIRLNFQRGLIGVSILASGLLVSACGVSNIVTSNAPIKVHISNKHGSKQPAQINAVNNYVATYLKSNLHLKKVVVGQAPPGTVGLQAFLDNPSSASANRVHTGPIAVGAEGWIFENGVTQLPSYQGSSAELSSIGGLAQATIASLPANTRAQIEASKAVYVDFAYGTGGQLAYIVFWWGSPTP